MRKLIQALLLTALAIAGIAVLVWGPPAGWQTGGTTTSADHDPTTLESAQGAKPGHGTGAGHVSERLDARRAPPGSRASGVEQASGSADSPLPALATENPADQDQRPLALGTRSGQPRLGAAGVADVDDLSLPAISGRVRGDGAPLSEAEITLLAVSDVRRGDLPVITVLSDSGGYFSVMPEPGFIDWRVIARHDAFGAVEERIDLSRGNVALEFDLPPGRELVGVLLNGNGAPVGDAEISLLPFGDGASASFDARATRSDPASGSFAFGGIAPGSWCLLVTAHGFARREIRVVVESKSVEQEITLEPAHELSGIVRGPAGEPIARAQVIVYAPGTATLAATTADDGTFTLGELSSPCRVEVCKPGFIAWIRGDVRPDAGPLGVELEPGYRFAGVVLEDETGAPVAGVDLVLTCTAAGRTFVRRAWTDPLGAFHIEGLPPGEHALAFGARGYVTDHASVTVPRADDVTTYHLRGAATYSARFVDANGAAVSGVFMRLEGLAIDTDAPSAETVRATRSGDTGTCRLEDLAEGLYTLVATHSDLETLRTEIVVDATSTDEPLWVLSPVADR